MFSSRFFRSGFRVFKKISSSRSSSEDYSKLFNIGAIACGITLFSFSSALCNDDHVKELLAGEVADLAEGTMKRVQVGEDQENFILVSKVNGKVYATGGKCSHYGAPLQMGYLDGHNVICPWHAATFDVRTGELLHSPGVDSIPTYAVSIKEGKIVVQIPESKFSNVTGTHPSKKLVKRDPNNKLTYVVVGGGAAGNTAVETLRKEGFTGRIIFLTAEGVLPYDRVVLSKNLKLDSGSLSLRAAEFYQEYDIEVQTNAEVKSIDEHSKVLVLRNGDTVSYDKVLLATGCVAKIPGPYRQYATNYSNVFTLRSAADHTKFKGALSKAQNVLIVGAGFVGLETAWAIRRDFPEKSVTVIDVNPKPLVPIFGSEIANQLLMAHRQNGVNVITGQSIESFNGSNGVITSISFSSPILVNSSSTTATEVPADLVLFSTGAEINTGYSPSALRNLDGSFRVNSHFQTENPSIYAAGDIAQFPSLLTESRERVEHWAVAQQQGRLAALNMLEKGQNYLDVPFFWSNQFLNVNFAGFSNGHDWTYTEVKDEELPLKAARITYFYKGPRCIGVAAINWPGATLRLKIALHRGLMPSKEELLNKKVKFADIVEKVKNSNPCGGNCCRN